MKGNRRVDKPDLRSKRNQQMVLYIPLCIHLDFGFWYFTTKVNDSICYCSTNSQVRKEIHICVHEKLEMVILN